MKLKSALKIAYITVFFGFLVFVGVLTFTGRKNTPAKEAEVRLEITEYSKWGKSIDKYVSANFGLRNNFINMNNRLKYSIFNESGEKNVILGKEDWLFYESALHDYIGTDRLHAGEIIDTAKVIKNMQDAVTKAGGKFIFCVAPNKMEIYAEYMPYFLNSDNETGNYELLMDALEEEGVNYVDLKSVLKTESVFGNRKLYYKLDSHWNNFGAGIAYMEIMKKAGLPFTDYSKTDYVMRRDFDGDLYGMLFPDGSTKDEGYYFKQEDRFSYTSRFMGVDDLLITTVCKEASNPKVRLYRDSFGNALYTFFANDFCDAKISRATEYDMTGITEGELVVVEIVERNIANILKNNPLNS